MIKFSNLICPSGYEWCPCRYEKAFHFYMREKIHSIKSPVSYKFVSFPQQNVEALHIQFANLDEKTSCPSNKQLNAFLQFSDKYGPLTPIDSNTIEFCGRRASPIEEYMSSITYLREECHLLSLARNIFLIKKENNITNLKKQINPLISISECHHHPFFIEKIDLMSSTQLLDAITRVLNRQSSLEIKLLDEEIYSEKYHTISTFNLPPKATIRDIFDSLLGSIIKKKMLQHENTAVSDYSGTWDIDLSSKSLIAYIWASFFEEVSGKSSYKQCNICGEWVDCSGLRKDWTQHPNCGAKNRMRKYRERIKFEKEGE